MEEKYLKYSIEDFTHDLKFIKWVKGGKNQNDWETLIEKNPELTSKIETAKIIVNAFQSSVKDVKEEEMHSVWRNIEVFYISQHKENKMLRIRKMMLRYAAMLTLLIVLGSVMSYFYFNRDNKFPDSEIPSSASNNAKLILPGGEEILLKEKQSELEFDAAGNQIKIDQEKVIDYGNESPSNEMAQVIVPYGKRSDIRLPDGSKVWLNAGSKLIFPQKFTNNKKRHVYLQGEAYFDVSRNEEVPFVVTLDNIDVTVLGTEFNMNDNNYNGQLEIVLVEGGISLKENKNIKSLLKKEIKLKPNQKAIYNKTDDRIEVESDVDVTYFTSWKEGIIEFRRENITNVFKQLSKYYNVKFVTEKSVELNRKISGKLDLKESFNDVMKVVTDAAPITYRIEEGTVYVNSKINILPMR